MSLSSIPRQLRTSVFLRDRELCQYCHLAQVGQAATFRINHVVPRSRGGLTTLDNLVLQCPICSLHKSDKITGRDPVVDQTVALFHPLRKPWTGHFAIMEDGGCVGTSPVGRATVTALRMNDPLPKTARAMQMSIKLIK